MRRFVQLVHSLPGRTRLRLAWLRHHPEEATALADALAAQPGIEEVQVRPSTGSVLVLHEPDLLGMEGLLTQVQRVTGGLPVVRPGERPPEDGEALARTLQEGSSLARAAARFVRGVNTDVVRASEGKADLGMLTAMGFVALGVGEVVTSGKLPLPPWFSLGWWAFRTFFSTEQAALEHSPRGLPGEAAPQGA
jgi:hypothetical protein